MTGGSEFDALKNILGDQWSKCLTRVCFYEDPRIVLGMYISMFSENLQERENKKV